MKVSWLILGSGRVPPLVAARRLAECAVGKTPTYAEHFTATTGDIPRGFRRIICIFRPNGNGGGRASLPASRTVWIGMGAWLGGSLALPGFDTNAAAHDGEPEAAAAAQLRLSVYQNRFIRILTFNRFCRKILIELGGSYQRASHCLKE